MDELPPSLIDNPPQVTLTASGRPQKLIGRISPQLPDTLQEFRGIPYATAPGRWRHSVVRDGLPSDEFLATKNGPQCPQSARHANTRYYQSDLTWPSDVTDDELECLNLFIVRPSPEALAKAGLDPKDPLPVFFYIHGGGFGYGAATDPPWDPSRLVASALARRKPFLAVAINYRLGIFGFGISTDILAIQSGRKGGNFGLVDQANALLWVSRNIAAFGGDAARITVAGQSAGSVSVHAQLLDARYGARPPLFRRALLQSGGLETAWPMNLAEKDDLWRGLYGNLNISEGSSRERVDKLLALSADELVAAAVRLGWVLYRPVVDGVTIRELAPGQWSTHLQKNEEGSSGKAATSAGEMAVFVGDAEDEYANGFGIPKIKSLEEALQLFSSVPQEPLHEIFDAYGIKADTPLPDLHILLSKIMTDATFGLPSAHVYQQFLSNSKNQTRPSDGSPALASRARRFRFKAGNPFPGVNKGYAHHCIDLIYAFDCFHADMAKVDAKEGSSGTEGRASNVSLVSEVQRYWVDFICDDELAFDESVAVVFGADRRVREENMAADEDWLALARRCEVVERHRGVVGEMRAVLEKWRDS